MTQAAASPSAVLTLANALCHFEDQSTRPGSLWGAIVPAMQTSHPTQATIQIVAQEYMTAPQPVRPQAFNLILTSRIAAQMQSCILLMSLASQFSRAPQLSRRVTLLPSAPKNLLGGWLPFGPFKF